MIKQDENTLVIFSDIGCPWAALSVYRLHKFRKQLGLEEKLRFDFRSFPLEIINSMPMSRILLDEEIPILSTLEPGLDWHIWRQGRADEFPVSTLLAQEAVQAAKSQGIQASEKLDFGLRKALFSQSRCITMRHVILEVAKEVNIDVESLTKDLDNGTFRSHLFEQLNLARQKGVVLSPTICLPNGKPYPNPGIEITKCQKNGRTYLEVTKDDSQIYIELIKKMNI